MSDTFFADLVLRGTVGGRNATEQDYADAVRSVRDQAVRYYQHGDECGEALARLATSQLLAARLRREQAVPY